MLPTHAQLLQVVDNYRRQFPDEKGTVSTFVEFVKRNSGNSVYSRKNFDGHFTASAFLVNEDKTKVLFLKHKKLGRWLQPGGHIDATDESILSAALREVTEETGLQSVDLELVNQDIFDLDAHTIPENLKKNEAAHVHYDVRYLLTVIDDSAIYVNKAEAEELQWLPLDKIKKLDGFARVAAKLLNHNLV